MTAKEFLSLAWHIDARLRNRVEERDRLRANLEAGRSAKLTGMPRGGSGSDWTASADRLVELDRRIGADIAELCRVKLLIADAIDAVPDVKCRTLLELRYRTYHTWEWIAEEMDITPRWAQILHGRALQLVKIPDEFIVIHP